MNGLDIVILVAFFSSTLIGAMRGFTKEILSLFSWGGSIALSYIFLPAARGFVHPYIANPMMADGAALFCLFIIFLIILSIIASIIAGYIHESSFRGVDHSLGFGFGMLRGVVFISTVELVFSTFSPRHIQSSTIQTARFVPMARKGGDIVLQILPASLRATIMEQAAKVENQINAKVHERLKTGNTGEPGTEGSASEGLFEGSDHKGASEGAADYGGHASLFNHSSGGLSPMPGSLQRMAQSQQGGQAQPQGGNNHLSQPGQLSPLASSSESRLVTGHPSPPGGIGRSASPQDTQLTVDELARLKPQSSPKKESGYTRGQRDDMNRLFQAADGE